MAESAELSRLTRRFYEAIASGDAQAVGEIAAPSVVGIGSEADEWWDNAVLLADHIRSQIDELGGPMSVLFASPQASSEGSVGWVADRKAAFRLGDGSTIPFRFTAVFHREDASWRLVQFHISVAVSNADAMGAPTEV